MLIAFLQKILSLLEKGLMTEFTIIYVLLYNKNDLKYVEIVRNEPKSKGSL